MPRPSVGTKIQAHDPRHHRPQAFRLPSLDCKHRHEPGHDAIKPNQHIRILTNKLRRPASVSVKIQSCEVLLNVTRIYELTTCVSQGRFYLRQSALVFTFSDMM